MTCKHSEPFSGSVVITVTPPPYPCSFCEMERLLAEVEKPVTPPPYLCSFCEMERLLAEVEKLRAALREACEIADSYIADNFATNPDYRRIAELRALAEGDRG